MSAIANALRIAPVAMVVACSSGPIDWDDNPSAAPQDPVTSAVSVPTQPAMCAATVVSAIAANGVRYAAWWSMRPDSTADIMAASSADGRAWSLPARLDSADVGRAGCHRPPPAIAADGDNLQVVYAMKAREGPGYFLAHSMDRAHTFHSPVAVVYGEKLGLASVAASGNLVVVAYEDPNTTPTRISVALSTTMAHLFDYREVVSPEDAAASQPRVYLAGTHVTLTWRRGDGTQQTLRAGTIR